MGTPTFKLIYDRQHRASKTKEGSVELRITYDRKQKHVTTGIRLLELIAAAGHHPHISTTGYCPVSF